MKQLFALVIVAVVLSGFSLLGGCSPKVIYDTDTLHDTLRLIKSDTIIVKDTINDTLIVFDTIIVKDTIGKYYEYITFHTFLPETLLLFNEYSLEYEENVPFLDNIYYGFIQQDSAYLGSNYLVSNSNRERYTDYTYQRVPLYKQDRYLYKGARISDNILEKTRIFPIVPVGKDMKLLCYITRSYSDIVDSSLNLSKKVKAIINPLEVKEVYKDKKVYKALLGVKKQYINLWKDKYFVDGLYQPVSILGLGASLMNRDGVNFDSHIFGYATNSKGDKVLWDGSFTPNRGYYWDTLSIETPTKYLETDFKLSEVFIDIEYRGIQVSTFDIFYAQGTTDTLKVQW